MNNILHFILIIASLLFLGFIVNMVRSKRLELKYALTWLFTSCSFVILSLFPRLLNFISNVLHVKEPVNAIFLSVIFFLLLIVFSLTVALSRNAKRVKTLAQEIGIMKLSMTKSEKSRSK